MPECWEALDNGATLVTANARLARDLRRAYDVRQLESGRRSWTAADILDWSGWVRRTWNRAAQYANAEPVVILSQAQEELLWEQIIERNTRPRDLLNVPATAAAAANTFRLASAWRVELSEPDCVGFEDASAFVTWLREFEEALESRGWRSESQLPAEVAKLTAARKTAIPTALFHAGFDELTPSQRRCFSALTEAGCSIGGVAPPSLEQRTRVRMGMPDARAELEAAARWSREKLKTSPVARVGVVLTDLAARVGEVERVFEDALHPCRDLRPVDGKAAFHISAGEPLSQIPAVLAAFQALQLGLPTATIAQAGLLLRSPFLAGSEAERGRRALLDTELRSRGFAEVTVRDLARLAGNGAVDAPYACPILARALRAWCRAARALPERQAPSEWSRSFSRLLRLTGWPGERTLSSSEYQAIRSWNDLLSEFAALDLVSGPIAYSEALSRLHRMAAATRFGAADEHAPVQIMGIMEAAGSAFDALWVAGMEDRAWPAPAKPNPFLPPDLQRRLGLPHSSAARELAFARITIGRLLESSPEVVVSYPLTEDDTELRPSPLILDLDEAEALPPVPSIAALLAANPDMETFEDAAGPPVEPGSLTRGGSAILERQAACPFGAFAQFRLEARPLEAPAAGFSPQERGVIVHRALENFWEAVRTRDALLALSPDERVAAVKAAATSAIEAKTRGRGVARSARLIYLEQQRLERLLQAWLDVESGRDPFTVKEREAPGTVNAGGVSAEIRMDRVDALPDGREVIIDYKTSKSSPSEWEGSRPDAPQLPLYAANRGANVAAVLFAQLVPGDLRFRGLGENAGFPRTEYAASKLGKAANDTLAEHIASWGQTLDSLGAAFCAGEAAPSPKRASNCKTCGFPAVCRIADLGPAIDDVDPEPPGVSAGEEEA